MSYGLQNLGRSEPKKAIRHELQDRTPVTDTVSLSSMQLELRSRPDISDRNPNYSPSHLSHAGARVQNTNCGDPIKRGIWSHVIVFLGFQ